jgi:hypothetical protein
MLTPSPTEGDPPTPTASLADSGAAPKASPADTGANGTAELTVAQAQAIIADLRRENQAKTAKLTAFEKAQQDAENARLSDIEKANKRAEEAEAKTLAQRTRLANQAVEIAARALGIIDPELAALAIAKDLQIDDDGNPTNADALLKKLTTDKPYLLAPANGRPQVTSGGATKPSASSATPGSDLNWDVISKLTPAEYEARERANPGAIAAYIASHPLRR